MTLYFDTALRRFVTAPGVSDTVSAITFKRGDTLNIKVIFCVGAGVVELTSGATGKLGLKEIGEYSADFITAATSWTKTGTGTSTYYTFELPLNTTELNDLLALDASSVALMLEMQYAYGDYKFSSNTVTATVQNDVIKDSETGPTTITDGTPVNQTSATSTLTVDNQPEAADTLIITCGLVSETWTFVSGTPGSYEIQIGASVAATATNIISELADSNLVIAASGGSGIVNLTAAVSGTAGQYETSGTSISGADIIESAEVAAVDATAGTTGTMKVDSSYLYVVCSMSGDIPTWKKISLSSL